MQRRDAIKIFSLGGLVAFVEPTIWAKAYAYNTPNSSVFTANEKLILKAIIEIIIPEGAEPGAIGTNCHVLVNRIISDCYSTEDHKKIKMGLDEFNKKPLLEHNKTFLNLTKNLKNVVVKNTDMAFGNDKKHYWSIIKQLTILGYMNSEYVQTKHYGYLMNPGKYEGCIPLNP